MNPVFKLYPRISITWKKYAGKDGAGSIITPTVTADWLVYYSFERTFNDSTGREIIGLGHTFYLDEDQAALIGDLDSIIFDEETYTVYARGIRKYWNRRTGLLDYAVVRV